MKSTSLTHYRSMRDWLDALRRHGDLQEIQEEVDWNLEMGAITRRTMELRAPAPLFEKVKGIERGFRALGAPGGLTSIPQKKYLRIALALGLPAEASGREIVDALAMARLREHIEPTILLKEQSPCKQNVLVGSDVDMLRLPTPLIHGHDGGRYLQTYGMNIVRTPDGAWTNWSINRMMLVDGKRLACLIPPNQHLGIIHAKWREIGKPTPVAIAFGVEPALPFVGGMPIAEGLDESKFLGAYFGEPIELTKAETLDLHVPATAEIVIEGHISHTEKIMEGPMDEYPGYVGEGATPKPVLTVEAMTFRNDPILPFSVAGAPVDENHTGWGIPHAAEVLYLLRTAELPVSTCWTVLEAACHLMLIAVKSDWHEQTGWGSKELCERIGDVVFKSKPGFGLPKLLIAEDDFDTTDAAETLWVFASRAHPSHGEIYFKDEAQNILPVFLDPDEKFSFRTTKVVHNALLADRYPKGKRPIRSDFAHAWPKAIQDRVLSKWQAYGFGSSTDNLPSSRTR